MVNTIVLQTINVGSIPTLSNTRAVGVVKGWEMVGRYGLFG